MKATKEVLRERVIAYAVKRNMTEEWVMNAINENIKFFEGYTPARAYEACISLV